MIHDAYQYLIKRDYKSLNELPNDPRINEIELIKLMGLQISKRRKINILPEIEKLGKINTQYSYLLFEAKFIAQLTIDRNNKTVIQDYLALATQGDDVAVFALMYRGIMLDSEKRYQEANYCYKKIIDKYPFLEKARVASGYNLCFYQKKYTDAETIIQGGDKNFINWVNLNCIALAKSGFYFPVIAALTVLLLLIYNFAPPVFGLLWLSSAVLLLWSSRANQTFIFSISLTFVIFGFVIILIFQILGLFNH